MEQEFKMTVAELYEVVKAQRKAIEDLKAEFEKIKKLKGIPGPRGYEGADGVDGEEGPPGPPGECKCKCKCCDDDKKNLDESSGGGFTQSQVMEEMKKMNARKLNLENFKTGADVGDDDVKDHDIVTGAKYPSDQSKKDFWDAAVEYDASKIQSVFNSSNFKQMQLLLCDGKYWALPKDKVDAMVGEINTKQYQYIPERFDCDKFATQFSAEAALIYGTNAVGMVLDSAGQHSYNVVVVAGDKGADPTIAVYEPQNDEAVLKPDPSKHYDETIGIIIFL